HGDPQRLVLVVPPRRHEGRPDARGDPADMTTADAGYGIIDAVFSHAELAPVVGALDGNLATRSRAGARHVLALPEVRALARHPRLIELAARFIGPAQPFRATLFDKSASANWLVVWHQ